MTPASRARELGFKNLSVISNTCNVNKTTLYNWYRHKPVLFECVLAGCAVMLSQGKGSTNQVWLLVAPNGLYYSGMRGLYSCTGSQKSAAKYSYEAALLKIKSDSYFNEFKLEEKD